MDRASKFIRDLNLPGDAISPEELACAAWPQAVGKKIAAHTRAAKLVRNRLVVEVEDAVWQHQLFTLEPLIIRGLAKILGPGLVEETVFSNRAAPARAAAGSAIRAGTLRRRSRRN